MAISFVAAGALAMTATLPQLSIVAPSLVANDIMIAVCYEKAEDQVWSAPADWTLVGDSEASGGTQRAYVFWKRAVAADSGATFVFTVPVDNNATYAGVISAWRGCTTTQSPIDQTAPTFRRTGVASDTVTYNDFNPTELNAWVVAIGCYSDDLTTAGAISGTDPTFVNNWDLELGTGSDASIFGYSGASSGAATGSRSHSTTSMTDAINLGILFGLISEASIYGDPFGQLGQRLMTQLLST